MKDLENITIGQLLRRTASGYPDNEALICNGQVYTYSELDSRVDMCARQLLGLGIKKGTHIGIMCEIGLNDIVLMYAAARIGAVACLINTGLRLCEVAVLCDLSDIDILIAGEGCVYVTALELKEKLSDYQKKNTSVYPVDTIGIAGVASEDRLKAAEENVYPDDTAFIIYTSGTTSISKAVMGSHFSRVNCSMIQARDIGASADDRFLAALPAFHCFCLSVNIFAACCVGACVVVPKSRRTADILSCIRTYRCTLFSAVPTLFHAIISRADIDDWDVSSLRAGFIGGSYCSPELFCNIEKKLGMSLLSSLGQTEATAGFTVTDFSDSQLTRATTLGHPMDHVELAFADINTKEHLQWTQEGEILVRGYCLMQGYYNCPPLCRNQIDKDGWLHTGDVGCMDENGNLVLKGRIKDLIIRGGENISPVDIEGVTMELKGVQRCRAFGVPDNHYGEEICLAVIRKEGSGITADYIRENIASKLAEYKAPKYVLFMDEFPVTSTGKVKTEELKKKAMLQLKL